MVGRRIQAPFISSDGYEVKGWGCDVEAISRSHTRTEEKRDAVRQSLTRPEGDSKVGKLTGHPA
jgi:hypothetical protein